MSNFKSITNGQLKIILDLDYLEYQKNQVLNLVQCISEEMVGKKNKKLSEVEIKNQINRLYQLALDIVEGKVSFDIFSCVNLTKEGKFHKSKSTLVATSGIKDVFNGDYFSLRILELRLVPVSYPDKVNPFLFTDDKHFPFATGFSGNGFETYLEMDWFSHSNSKEVPIVDENGVASKPIVERNKYLKQKDVKVGYSYIDAKDNEYIYMGQYILDYLFTELNKNITTLDEYLTSSYYTKFCDRKKNIDEYGYVYIKRTKKVNELLKKSNNLYEFLNHFWDLYSYETLNKLKWVDKPLKFVSEKDFILTSGKNELFTVQHCDELTFYYYMEKLH